MSIAEKIKYLKNRKNEKMKKEKIREIAFTENK